MMNFASLRRGLLGLALGVLLTLALAPQTGWILRRQTLMAFDGDLFDHPSQAAVQQIAAAHPLDERLQFAAITRTDWGISGQIDYLTHLRGLEARFPGSPSLRANILRHATNGVVKIQRQELVDFDHHVTPKQDFSQTMWQNTPAQLAAYDQDAAAGEAMDPQNAYFPFMRAIGFYAAHRDGEARAAILRAGTKTKWREYYDDETYGQWKLHELASGRLSAIYRMASFLGVLFPHYGPLENTARMAADDAMKAEAVGHIHPGMELRASLLRLGSLMRTQSKMTIGALVAAQIEKTAVSRPGGSPLITNVPAVTKDAKRQMILDTFCRYAKQHSEYHTARLTQEEFTATTQALQVIQTGLPDEPYEKNQYSPYGASFARLTAFWVAGPALLINLFILVCLSLIAFFCVKGDVSTPYHRFAVRWGLTLGLFTSLMFSWLNNQQDINRHLSAHAAEISLAFPLIMVTVFIGMTVSYFRMRPSRMTLSSLKMIAIAGVALIFGQAVTGIGIRQAYFFEEWAFPHDMPPSFLEISHEAYFFASLFTSAVIPILLTLSFIFIARVKRVPVLAGVVHGFARWGLPAASVLTLIFGGVILGTVRQEQIEQHILQQAMQGEGAYYARMLGQDWPGPVR